MSKKLFVGILTVLTLLFGSSFVFANNDLGDELKSSWNKTEGTMDNVGSAIGNTIGDITGANDQNRTDNSSNNNGIMGMSASDNGGYTATRTSAEATNTGLNGVAWTWIILAVTAVVIVSLIWYYASQENKQTKINEEN